MARLFTVLLLWATSACGVAAPSTSEAGLQVNTAPTPATHGWFPIDAASPHSALQCGDCHGTGSSFQEFACTSCHTHSLDVLQPQHANVSGFVDASPSCYGCHPHPEIGSP